MNNYSKGVIYTVRYRNDDSLIYVGSTIQPLYKRWHQHKKVINNEKDKCYNRRLYQKIRETNDIDNWYIELYENYPCESIQELRKREGEVIREIGNLNMVINGRNTKEYYEDNKKNYKEYQKKNAYLIKEYQKEYRNKNAINIKEYYEDKKDIILKRQKEYNDNNKDKLKEKIKCDCGGCYTYANKSIHFKRKIHIDYENNKNKV